MSLDVVVPEPPDLTNRGAPRGFEWDEETLGSEEFSREDIQDVLQEGAWKEGFNEWAAYTDLDEPTVRVLNEIGLFRAFDFYRDPVDGVLHVDSPTIADDWREAVRDEPLAAGSERLIDEELRELGRAVSETLAGYLETDGDASDDGWDEDAFDASGE